MSANFSNFNCLKKKSVKQKNFGGESTYNKNPFLKRHLLLQDILQVHLFYVQVDSSTK